MLPVSFGQWDRLKARVEGLGNPRVDFINYAAAAWGICVPCAISFIVYVSQRPRSPWAVASYGAFALAAFVAALLLHHFERQEKDVRQEDARDIVSEMDSIAEAYLRGQELD